MASAKGDMQIDRWLMEAKSTVNDSMKLDYKWLGKISQEALQEGRDPALSIIFTNPQGRAVNFGDWVMVPRSVWEEITSDE